MISIFFSFQLTAIILAKTCGTLRITKSPYFATRLAKILCSYYTGIQYCVGGCWVTKSVSSLRDAKIWSILKSCDEKNIMQMLKCRASRKQMADDSLILNCAWFLFERREISYPLLITRDTLTLHVMDEFRSLSNQSINGYLPMDV